MKPIKTNCARVVVGLAGLLVLPVGLPLLDEGGHALLAVVGAEGHVEEALLGGQALLQGGLVGGVRGLGKRV